MAEERALSVSEAMNGAKRALESVRVRVVGEVSEFNDKPGYKAAYFTVCDEGASMPCMMWRDAYIASGVELRCGMLVEMSGFFSAYVPKGRMQFMARSVSLAGEGMLRMQVADLARKLEAEGLMAASRKRALPEFPTRIALVTSPRGKAVHDVIRTLKRRYPMAELLIAGVAVEGADAPRAIVEGLRVAAEAGPDLILLVRGGGSYEDLMPFNHESVARQVAASSVPVITGIGHEPDDSIADMVADFRASTPTAAAEAAAPAIEEIRGRLTSSQRLLARALLHRVQHAVHRVRLLVDRPVFTDPNILLAQAWQALDVAGVSLQRAIPSRLERDAQRLEYTLDRLVRLGPSIPKRAGDRVAMGAARLNDLSPLAILGRGYAVAFGADGSTVLRNPADVSIGDSINVRVQGGTINGVVQSTRGVEDR
ncbi:MAG: exodeoxyribonuclease VII large subunit [Coriobacteriia bacterium]|nr:exodeoxyribonuclease VII large subunit [Coriobacteriia bacterium]